jgi:hypothetical protein
VLAALRDLLLRLMLAALVALQRHPAARAAFLA